MEAMRCTTDLLRAVLALRFRPPQRLVGARELAGLVRRLRGLLLRLLEPPRRLLLARAQERLQAARAQLRHRALRLRGPVQGRPPRRQRRHPGPVEQRERPRARLQAAAGAGQPRAVARLLLQQLFRGPGGQAGHQRIDGARAGVAQVAFRRHLRVAELA
jgi:hypothetical protein